MGKKRIDIDLEELIQKNRNGQGHYVSNDALMRELYLSHKKEEEYIEKFGKVPDSCECITSGLAIMMTAIATKLASASKFNYKTIEDQEDCVSHALMDCLKYWRGFNRNDVPKPGEDGKPMYNEDGSFVMYRPEYNMDLIPTTMLIKNHEMMDNYLVIDTNGCDDEEQDEDKSKVKKIRVLVLNEDGTIKMKKPNPFSYFTTVCTNGLAKGWKSLGYTDLPFSKRVYISDSIYSI